MTWQPPADEYLGRVSPWWNIVFMEPRVLTQLCTDAGWEQQTVIACRPSYILVARRHSA